MREDVWLGKRLGCRAWTIEEGDAASEIAARGRGFFQAKVPALRVDRIGELEQIGFRTIDANITMRREPRAAAGEGAAVVRDADPGDRSAVADIAARDYSVSRFHLDPKIPDEVASAIKRDWIENFFLDVRGDRLLVADCDGRTVGFLLILETVEAAVIDLIAVASPARGRGAGTALVVAMVNAHRDRPVLVGTQVANVGALRFYERLGFTVQHTQFVLHRHA